MTSYYKPKTKKICHTDYRKYIVPRTNPEVVSNLQEDENESYPFLLLWGGQNHPLVKAGKAYWVTGTQLCTGYTIGNVFRPIFNYKRENIAFEVRKYITKFAKIHVTHARSHLYKQELMKLHNKTFPEEIVDYIAQYAWDIMLLL